MKERLGMTEIRKQANRLNFGEVRNIKTYNIFDMFEYAN